MALHAGCGGKTLLSAVRGIITNTGEEREDRGPPQNTGQAPVRDAPKSGREAGKGGAETRSSGGLEQRSESNYQGKLVKRAAEGEGPRRATGREENLLSYDERNPSGNAKRGGDLHPDRDADDNGIPISAGKSMYQVRKPPTPGCLDLSGHRKKYYALNKLLLTQRTIQRGHPRNTRTHTQDVWSEGKTTVEFLT